MLPLATIADLRQHWPAMTTDMEDDAEHKLFEASVIVRGLYPWVDQRIENGTLSAATVTYVVCDMVKTALNVGETDVDLPSNVSQASFTTGPYTQNLSFRSNDGNLFLTKLHRQLLTGGGSRNRRAFTIIPGG